MSVFTWAVSVLVAALLVSFVVYLVSLRRLPLQIDRPLPQYDRLGRASAGEEQGSEDDRPS